MTMATLSYLLLSLALIPAALSARSRARPEDVAPAAEGRA